MEELQKNLLEKLGYTRDSFFATVSYSESGKITSDKTYEEVLKAVKQNKYVGVKIRGENIGLEGQDYLLPFAATFELEGSTMVLFGLNGMSCIFFPNGDVHCDKMDYMATSDMLNYNFDAEDKSILNLADSDELTSAVTRGYTDNSTPTFIFLEEQDGAIKSKVTDLNTLKTALMSQTNGYTQTSNPLYKAIKCYAVLDGNCYDLVYSSQENANIVKRTFYAITTDGLNKLNVVIDENQTDENQKVVWTKEAQGVASEQFIVTVQDVDGVDKSDKTPAEIAEAVNAGKQVILQDSSVGVVQSCYLVNASNDVATFCGTEQLTDGTADLDPIFSRCWYTILNDQTALYTYDFNIAHFAITKDANGKYTSVLSPEVLLMAITSGCAANALLGKDGGGVFFGTIYYDDTGVHIYFPDYAKNLIYDLKWNRDENPSTYTFTELTLGGGTASGEPLTVHITEDSSTKELVADKTYEEIVAAIKSGRNVRCQDGLWEYYSSYYTYRDADRRVTFVIEFPMGENDKELFQVVIMTYAITEDNKVVNSTGNLSIPYGLLHTAGKNQILKTDENGAMKYVDANRYLVKQATSSESGLFLSTDGYGGQEWANPLTAGNNDSVVIKSSTPKSTKKFRITVDDAGTISATEVT